MANKPIAAETLIELAAATLRANIVPALPADKRYTAAMIASALEIARREILNSGETVEWGLLDSVYEDGEGSLQRLAADIRAGKVSDKTHPGLGARLRALVIAELEIRNPRFLESRGIKV